MSVHGDNSFKGSTFDVAAGWFRDQLNAWNCAFSAYPRVVIAQAATTVAPKVSIELSIRIPS
jgi:hypothetical protein